MPSIVSPIEDTMKYYKTFEKGIMETGKENSDSYVVVSGLHSNYLFKFKNFPSFF